VEVASLIASLLSDPRGTAVEIIEFLAAVLDLLDRLPADVWVIGATLTIVALLSAHHEHHPLQSHFHIDFKISANVDRHRRDTEPQSTPMTSPQPPAPPPLSPPKPTQQERSSAQQHEQHRPRSCKAKAPSPGQLPLEGFTNERASDAA
jgi:hypothetical protein